MLEKAEQGWEALGLPLLWAELFYQEGAYQEALARYTALAAHDPSNARTATGAGLAALKLSKLEDACHWLGHATSLANAGSKAWNGLGICLDHKKDWAASEAAYKRALHISASGAIWNNYGYSLLLQQRYEEAADAFGRASADARVRSKAALNLEIAEALKGATPKRRQGERSADWARRLNNAGYAAWLHGDPAAAKTLLVEALKVSDVHFAKAEANLRLVENR
ncbi:MAG TPA: tetratricopeptide repeat protein [Allosphingosinicella sp.]|uniref:tetratricopeptide repeat protein n=1 Tax=Allosphingosinicella sp. TaxID=2823234 RepID=UPI002EDACAC4